MKKHLFIFLLLVSTWVKSAETTLETITVNAPAPDAYHSEESTTATRIPSKQRDIPQSIQTINQALLQDSQIQRLEEAALFVSGVQPGANQSGLDAELIIRGFPTAGATYLNGLLDNPRFQVHDIALIDKIEILKGHSSVLYGGSSAGGTVNYVTKKPQATAQQSFKLTAGNYDLYRGVVDSTGTVAGNQDLLYRVIAAGQFANTYRTNVKQDKATFAPSLSWQYAEQGKLDIDVEYGYENRPFNFDNVYTQGQVVYDRSYVDPRAKSARQHWRVSSQLSQALLEDWQLKLSSQYFHTERDELLIGTYAFANKTSMYGYYRDVHDHYDQLSLRGELHGKFSLLGTTHQLILGAERNQSHDYLNSWRNVKGFKLDVYQPSFDYPLPTTFTPLNNDVTSIERGYYLQDEINLIDLFHIFSGVRYGEFTAHGIQNNAKTVQPWQNALVYKAGLSWTPNDTITAYYGYNQSFQPNTGVDRAGQSFLPKRGILHELGIKTSFAAQKIHFSTALYQLKQQNILSPDPLDRDYQRAIGERVSHGVEVDLSAQLTQQLQILANYSWMNGKITQHADLQGKNFRSTPTHSGTVWGKYQLPFDPFNVSGKLSMGGGLVFVGKRWGDDTNSFQVAGYIRPDIFLHYQLPAFDFRVNIENLLNKRYVSTSVFNDTVTQGNRRLIQSSVSFHF